LTDFDPDPRTLELLGSEHQNGTWVGRELLPIANRIRNQGGTEDDYVTWVKASYLWTSYVGSTSDSAASQRKHLARAWDKSERSKPWDLEDALTDLAGRIATARWTGRSGSRNRAVALAFVRFCIEHNCFTRTISSYELSKHTAGMSPMTVGRGLLDLVRLGLLTKVERSDRRVTARSTGRYQVNLYWKPTSGVSPPRAAPKPPKGLFATDAMSTGKHSLPQLRTNFEDLWSHRGLGETARRVYEVVSDEPATVREISDRSGLSRHAARRALAKLTDNCLAGLKPERPARYFKVETPLDAVADMLGSTGYVAHMIDRTTKRQEANRQGYPSNYSQKATTEYGY
jgi:hypothetical protein